MKKQLTRDNLKSLFVGYRHMNREKEKELNQIIKKKEKKSHDSITSLPREDPYFHNKHFG